MSGMRTVVVGAILVFLLALAACGPAATPTLAPTPTPPKPANPDVILATTTSTNDTGLLDVLIPDFKARTGYNVKPVAVGSGAALAMGQRGEADVLLVHAPSSELPLVQDGTVTERLLVMHNSYAIVGPASDPAGIRGLTVAVDAMKRIADKQSLFVSRGDNSGTHQMEKSLWSKVGVTPSGAWYQEAGQGMGATLNIASEKDGYTLTDRGTYLAQKKNLSLDALIQGDPALLNIYHVMPANPAKFPKVNAEGGKAFAAYMVSPRAQAIIKDYGVDKYGEALFIPDAGKKDEELAR
ncbi:MAG: substrate-binding domain-containing protein [Chloroflexota bacterium]|nr:substrate-binding domain-containing protein [Chloroflexota bacterium]